MMEKLRKEKNRLFYLSYIMYSAATCIQMTMFTRYVMLSRILVWMRYVSFGLAAGKVLLDLCFMWEREQREGWKRTLFQRRSVQKGILIAAVMLVLLAGALLIKDRTLLFVAILLFASEQVRTDRIFRISLWVQGILMAGVMFSSKVGLIPDLLFKRDKIPIRHALGYTYPSVAISSFAFLILVYLWLKKSAVSRKEMLYLETINFLLFILTDSRTGFLLLMLVILGDYLYGFCKRSGLPDHDKVFGGFWRRIFTNCYDYLSLYLSAAFFGLCLLWPSSVSQFADRLLTNRIQYMAQAVRENGVHLLGTHVEWIGFGGAVNTDALLESYNFVDSSYGYILVNYGILIFIAVIVIMIVTAKSVRKREPGFRKYLFAVVVLYCLIEPRLLEIHLNPFLFLAVPAFHGLLRRRRRAFQKRRTEM